MIVKKILLVSLSVFCLVGCDYTSKKIAKDSLKDISVHSYLGGNLKFVYVENPGGMLSFGSDLPVKSRLIIFQLLVSLLLVSLFVYTILMQRIKKWSLIALILILSGGIGNLLDRITNEGRVVDFMMMGIYSFRTGIFNIADVYITFGVLVLILSEIFLKDHSAKIAS